MMSLSGPSFLFEVVSIISSLCNTMNLEFDPPDELSFVDEVLDIP